MQTKHIFLTGATGVLGAHLLKDILQSTHAKVTCLVRSDDLASGKNRLEKFLRVYDPEALLQKEFDTRVTPALGDVKLPQLGISDSEYSSLQASVDLTIHAAACTNLLVKYKNIMPINVTGTEHVIEFCLGTPTKKLSYVSTYTVVGSRGFDESLVFKETDLDVGQSFHHMSYQKSKFEAEKLVRQAEAKGLLWKIFRPGQIFGESKTGGYPHSQTQVSGLFYDLYKTAIETGYACRSDNYDFDMVPVDYVSQGILTLSLKRKQAFETFHLTNPDRKSFSYVIDEICKFGYNIQLTNVDQFKQLLQYNRTQASPYDSAAMRAFKLWFLLADFSFQNSAKIDTEFTSSVLAEYGVFCPKLDEKLLRVYFDQGIQSGYFPKPNRQAAVRSKSGVDSSITQHAE